jgi:hypothetical protein
LNVRLTIPKSVTKLSMNGMVARKGASIRVGTAVPSVLIIVFIRLNAYARRSRFPCV